MKKILVLFLVLFVTAGAVHANMEAYQSAKKDFKYIEHSDKVSRKSYKLVADQFYKIYSSNPKGQLGDDSLHYTAQTYYRSYVRYKNRDDLLKALKYLKVLASNYKSRLASLAYIQSAKLYEQQQDYPSARYMLKRLMARFPNTQDAKTAKNKLAEIEKKFQKSLYVDPVIETAEKNTPSAKPVVPAVKPVVDNSDVETAETAHSSKGSKEVSYGTEKNNVKVPAGKVMVKRVRHFSADDYTRVVLDISGKADFIKHWLKANPAAKKPPRLFIDLNDAVISKQIPRDIKIKDGLLRSLRWGYNRPGVARVVLDSDNVKDFTVFAMTDPHRIVIDVSGNPMKDKPQDNSSSQKYISSTKRVPTGTKVKNSNNGNTLASVFGLKINTIVIDPGHGGKDPGATYSGLKEKDIVLDVGKELYRLIKRDMPNVNVFMTRNRDVFIPLEARTAFANRKKADVFLSVHVNAAPNRKARGVETYVLNVTNDKKALQVAAAENQTTRKSMSDLQGILKDIMLNSKLEESLQLASFIQKSLHNNLYKSSRYNLGVKQAPFYVLVGAKMPSILVESGFVSNRNEAKMLRSQKYRKRIAEGIHKGLKSYIRIFNGENS
jgi:N-acetylmuramoyl-L-alanine amidase